MTRKYSMTQYLYDCYRLKSISAEIDYLNTITTNAPWHQERISALLWDYTQVRTRVVAYEGQPHNISTYTNKE